MPLWFRKTLDGERTIVTWKMTETEQALEELLRIESGSTNSTQSIVSSARRKEKLSAQAIINTHLGNPHTIDYHPSGAPFLRENPSIHISISHTKDICGVMFAPLGCGMDIEYADRNFTKASSKYISFTDALVLCQEQYGWGWCAKEAVYKQLQTAGVDFLTDLSILEITEQQIIVRSKSGIHSLDRFLIEGVMIVCTNQTNRP